MLLVEARFSFFYTYVDNTDLSIKKVNNLFDTIQELYNNFANVMNNKGNIMAVLNLKKVETYKDLAEIYNQNIETINKMFGIMDNMLSSESFDKADLEVTNLKFRNNTMKGYVTVNDDNVNVKWNNKSVTIDENGVVDD